MVILPTDDEYDEAGFVAGEAAQLQKSGRQWREIAVMYRTNAQSRVIEESFMRAGIPYKVVGGTRFYDRREIKDLVSWLRLIANPADDEAFRRAIGVPKRGIGETTVELLAAGAREAGIPLLAAAARPDLMIGARPATKAAIADFVESVDRFHAMASEASDGSPGVSSMVKSSMARPDSAMACFALSASAPTVNRIFTPPSVS